MADESTTRQQLVDGAIETIRRQGITGTSARSIAHLAGVDEALILHHFGSLHELLAEAGRVTTQSWVAAFRDRFDGLTSLREFLVVGRQLWDEERARGNVVVLSQLLAGARGDPPLAAATGSALQSWVVEVERVIRRLLADSPLTDLVDPALAGRAVCASFVGLSLFGAVDDVSSPFDILESLAAFAEDLKPFERRLLYARLRSHTNRSHPNRSHPNRSPTNRSR
ncbi:MAG: TetR/AcrR family transcriptional regulator [Pseudonocardiaceae bacterium]